MTARDVPGQQGRAAAQTIAPRGPDEPELLRRFGTGIGHLLGAGGEARVFALPDPARVLRVYAPSPEHRPPPMRPLLDSWADADLGFAIPRILEVGRLGRQSWTVEARLPGVPLGGWLAATPDAEARHRALRGLLDATARLSDLPLARPGFGLPAVPDRRFATLPDLLADRIALGLGFGGSALRTRLPDLDERVEALLSEVGQRAVEPRFVHGDLAPTNVLVDDAGRVTAVLDFSVHALAADPVLDLVGAASFVGLMPYAAARADADRIRGVLARRLGDEAWLVGAYGRFWALYYAMDPVLHDWCATLLR